MRNNRHIVRALLSCCVLALTQSCSIDPPKTELQNTNAEQNAGEIAVSTDAAELLNIPAKSIAISNVTSPQNSASAPSSLDTPGGVGNGGHEGGNEGSDEATDRRCGSPVDCANPACRGKGCNDHDGCTLSARCIDFECKEENPQSPCAPNECAVSTCHSTGDNSYYCSFELNTEKTDLGSCTPEKNCIKRNPDGTCADRNIIDQCVLGRCVLDELCPLDGQAPIMCKAQNRSSLPVGTCVGGSDAGKICIDVENSSDCAQGVCQPQFGCLDDNQCTADSCLTVPENNLAINDAAGKSQNTYQCHYETLRKVVCNTGNACEVSECQVVDGDPTCVPIQIDLECPPLNQCTGVLLGGGIFFDLCDTDATCIHQPIGPCIDDSQCPSGTCLNARQGNCSDDSSPCFSNDSCNPPAMCENGSLGSCTCETDNPCVIGVCDNTGACNPSLSTPSGNECSDGIICHRGTCDGSGNCITEPDNSACITESCNNACVTPVCTETGCDNIYTSGQVSCQVFVENNGLCQGSASCVNGVGECIPNQPLNCI